MRPWLHRLRLSLQSEVAKDNLPGRIPLALHQITDAGRADLATWFATPVSDADRPRDELAIKLALALSAPGFALPHRPRAPSS